VTLTFEPTALKMSPVSREPVNEKLISFIKNMSTDSGDR